MQMTMSNHCETLCSALPTVTQLQLVVLLLVLQLTLSRASENEEHSTKEEEEGEPADAILFPFFVMVVGIVFYYVLSRYASWLPYTAVCFLFGTILGVITDRNESSSNLLHASIHEWWIGIDSEVLLLTFLPGLVFKDAASLNVHLFQVAIGQCLLFAFPMVLAGTGLTALVAFYMFPYNWSFNLCMTLGAILSATDPVAVAALLDQVGAPPRLKVHIAGEALLNDGSAIVFFTIFRELYLHELGVEGLGREIGWAEGFKVFFRMSVGGACVGVLFALCLLWILNLLSRRLNREENIVETSAIVAMAYLCYFTAELAWGTSGVIATVSMGVTFNAFGRALVNDVTLLEDFSSLLEHFLNTVLFTLGGLVWGGVIANSNDRSEELRFTSKDWGYLIALYLALMMIRFLVFGIAYPLYSNIGLKSSWQEMVFQSYGGLRGAVGIALAISLDNTVNKAALVDESLLPYELETNKLFGYVGGIAFMTLMINATTAGPFLIKLGLADTSEIREQMLICFRRHWRISIIDDMVRLLAQRRFHRVNFALIRAHVPILKDLTKEELADAIERYSTSHSDTEKEDTEPYIDRILPYLDTYGEKDQEEGSSAFFPATLDVHKERTEESHRHILHRRRVQSAHSLKGKEVPFQELRRLFLELLRSSYEHQIKNGELGDREFVAFSLLQSLEFAADEVQKGEPLKDWKYVHILDIPFSQTVRDFFGKSVFDGAIEYILGPRAHVGADYGAMRIQVERCLSFMYAHKAAQCLISDEFVDDANFSEVEKQVLAESQAEINEAEKYMNSFPKDDVRTIVSHKFCNILLNNAAKYVESLTEHGVLKQQEAEKYVDEVQELLLELTSCDLRQHPGETDMNDIDEVDENDASEPKEASTR